MFIFTVNSLCSKQDLGPGPAPSQVVPGPGRQQGYGAAASRQPQGEKQLSAACGRQAAGREKEPLRQDLCQGKPGHSRGGFAISRSLMKGAARPLPSGEGAGPSAAAGARGDARRAESHLVTHSMGLVVPRELGTGGDNPTVTSRDTAPSEQVTTTRVHSLLLAPHGSESSPKKAAAGDSAPVLGVDSSSQSM